ncbi:hypothetical protein [Jiangella gansuensis]|uniref:hypothetical protein n=1 Tax=Jiangella gansuensis TaxID=281473 RepID=UPI00047CD46C|nr:hypothetical protein [Jiangella gansuensis]
MDSDRTELLRRLRLGDDQIDETDRPDVLLWTPKGHDVAVELVTSERDLSARIAALVADDAGGVFGPDVSAIDGAWRLLTIHLMEEYETMPAGHGRLTITPSGIVSS